MGRLIAQKIETESVIRMISQIARMNWRSRRRVRCSRRPFRANDAFKAVGVQKYGTTPQDGSADGERRLTVFDGRVREVSVFRARRVDERVGKNLDVIDVNRVQI